MRLLEKSPAARFQSAADTDWALAQVAVEEPGNQRVSARRALVDGVRRVGGRRLAVLAGVMAFASGAIWLGLSWRASAIEVPNNESRSVVSAPRLIGRKVVEMDTVQRGA